MPGVDEVAVKRKKARQEGGRCGGAMTELRWAILAAVTVAAFIFAATRIARPSNDPYVVALVNLCFVSLHG